MARDRLAALRVVQGYTQESLAHELGVAVSTVWRWEDGSSTPLPGQRRRLARLLDCSLEDLEAMLAVGGLDRPSPAGPVGMAKNWTSTAAGALTDTIQAADTEPLSADAAARLVHEWLVVEPPQSVELAAGRRLVHECRDTATFDRRAVTAGDVDAVREFTRTFRALDNRFGGGHSHTLAAQYLDINVAAMLREGRYTETVGGDLFGAAAQLAHLAAWTAYDTGGDKRAEHFFGRALELASAAGDSAFSGEILAARGHHAIHLRDPATAVELARASQQAAKTSGVPALLSEALALEANAYAMLGNPSACTAALREAEIAFDRAGHTESPEWLRYFDEGYLAVRFAHTLRDLGDEGQARHYALRAVAMSDSLTRTRAFNKVMLATTYVESELDTACEIGGEALALAAGLRSSRIVRYLSDFRSRLGARHRDDPLVARFEEKVTETLGVPA